MPSISLIDQTIRKLRLYVLALRIMGVVGGAE
jgi:hypothetical protein